jgi:O-antigen/teichoic acid export membrane protein
MTTPQQKPKPTQTQRTVRNFSALVLASLFSKGILFVWQIILVNWFQPTDYGIYNTVTSLMAVSTSLVSFGMGLIIIREVARDPQKIGAYWTSMLYLQTLFALVSYVLIIITAMSSGYSTTIIAFGAIGGLSLLVDMFGNVSYDLLIAQEKMTLTAIIEVGHIVLRVGMAYVVLSSGWGLLGVYAVTIASGVVRSLLLIAGNVRLGNRPHFPLDRPLTSAVLRDSLPLALSSFLSLAYQHADKLMTTAIIGERYTGYLGPAFIINYGMIELISTTILVSIYPLLARYSAQNEDMFGLISEKLARFMLIVGLPITLMVSLFATPIVLTIYNPNYLPTADILRILVWSTLLMMVGNVFSKALILQNRQRLSLNIRAISLAVNISLNFVLLHTFRDVRATPFATVIAELTALILSASVFRASGFAWGRVLPSMGRVILVGIVSAGVMIVVGQVHFILGALVGGGVYALGIILGGVLHSDDWDLLYRVVSSMPFGGIVQKFWQRPLPTNA